MFSIIKSFLEKLLSKLASLFGFVSKDTKDYCAKHDFKPSRAMDKIIKRKDNGVLFTLERLKDVFKDLSSFNTSEAELNAMMKETLGIHIHEIFNEVNNIPDVEFNKGNYFTEVFGSEIAAVPELDDYDKLYLILAVLTKRSSNLKHIDDHNFALELLTNHHPELPKPKFTSDKVRLDDPEFFTAAHCAACPYMYLVEMGVNVTKENIDKFSNLSIRNILLASQIGTVRMENRTDFHRKVTSIISDIPFEDFNPDDKGFIFTEKQQQKVDNLSLTERGGYSDLEITATIANFLYFDLMA